MIHTLEIRKVAFIGDYLPRKCGIATFTWDLRGAVATQYPEVDCIVTAPRKSHVNVAMPHFRGR